MQTQTLVSVVIPNYQHTSYLKQRIDSVLHQTFQDFELILLDDCSTDSSREIIEQYRNHPKVSQIIYNQENSGSVFKQWVKGIENSKGKYVWIAESDDYASELFLEETIHVLEQDTSIGMVFTDSNAVNERGEVLKTTSSSKKETYDQLERYHQKIDKDNVSNFLVSELVIENASSVVFRKESLLTLDFHELVKFVNTGDRFVYIGIALDSMILYLPKLLNYMRVHEYNTTKKSFESGHIHRDRLRVLNFYFSRITGSIPLFEKVNCFYRAHFLSFVHYGTYDDNVEVLRKIREKKGVNQFFYYSVGLYLYLFRKINLKPKILRSIYYRILLIQK